MKRWNGIILAVALLIGPILVLLYGYVNRVLAEYESQPLAEGRLSFDPQVYAPQAFSSDGLPLYPGDEKWEPGFVYLNDGFSSWIMSLSYHSGDLYAGGYFDQAGDKHVSNIARWDGTQWFGLGGGVNGDVLSLAASGNDVFAGGNFYMAGEQTVNYLARWDGSQWQGLDGGTDSPVESLAAIGNDLYAGGYFKQAGDQPVNSLARWDGSQWHDVGGGLNGPVKAILEIGDDLYVGGLFNLAGGQTVSNVARWDGSQWHDLGGGLDGIVDALAVSGSNLYAGGHFNQAGGQSAHNIARWDGAQWHPLGEGLGDEIFAIITSGNDVYAAGYVFGPSTQDYSTYGIARWDGSQWHNLGYGVYLHPYALATDGVEQVYVGGDLYRAGNNAAQNFAIWHITPEVTINYTSGAPGSAFLVNGRYFPANTPLTVSINGRSLPQEIQIASGIDLKTDPYGVIQLNLQTSNAAWPGTYRITFQVGGEIGSATYTLAAGQPVREIDESGAPVIIQVPKNLAPAEWPAIFMPFVNR